MRNTISIGSSRAYRITSPAHEAIVVVAAGIRGAVGALRLWRNRQAIGEATFTVDTEWAASLNGVGRQHLEAACRMCSSPSVLTQYRAGSGWTVEGAAEQDLT